MKKLLFLLLTLSMTLTYSCSSDDNDCPDRIEITTQEDLELAERCGLEPAEPVGNIWVAKDRLRSHE